jgi:surface antigen
MATAKGVAMALEVGLYGVSTPDAVAWKLWADGVRGHVAVVADVYTANAINNMNKSVLYEAVGPASEIYVVVEIGGQLWLTRGAVFSYREFKRSIDEPRLTDEEWQESLKQRPNEGVPTWMNEIVITLKNVPADNELIFYSTGC